MLWRGERREGGKGREERGRHSEGGRRHTDTQTHCPTCCVSCRLDAILHSITPLYKEDETDQCPFFDGVISARPDECDLPDYADNIYCTCTAIASSPHQISITWPDSEGNVSLYHPRPSSCTRTSGGAVTVWLSVAIHMFLSLAVCVCVSVCLSVSLPPSLPPRSLFSCRSHVTLSPLHCLHCRRVARARMSSCSGSLRVSSCDPRGWRRCA